MSSMYPLTHSVLRGVYTKGSKGSPPESALLCCNHFLNRQAAFWSCRQDRWGAVAASSGRPRGMQVERGAQLAQFFVWGREHLLFQLAHLHEHPLGHPQRSRKRTIGSHSARPCTAPSKSLTLVCTFAPREDLSLIPKIRGATEEGGGRGRTCWIHVCAVQQRQHSRLLCHLQTQCWLQRWTDTVQVQIAHRSQGHARQGNPAYWILLFLAKGTSQWVQWVPSIWGSSDASSCGIACRLLQHKLSDSHSQAQQPN